MSILNYLTVGIIFMFCIEYILNTESIKKQLKFIPNIGWVERIIGILFWPIWLVIFLYYFFKQLLK